MNTAIASVVLLVCIAVCTSEGRSVRADPRCLCTEISGVLAWATITKIATVDDYPPRPYCCKREVLACLKDGTRLCLNPDDNITKLILKSVKRTNTPPPSEK